MSTEREEAIQVILKTLADPATLGSGRGVWVCEMMQNHGGMYGEIGKAHQLPISSLELLFAIGLNNEGRPARFFCEPCLRAAMGDLFVIEVEYD